IYLGHGRAISALVNGVRVHGIYQLTTGFTAFIHTGLNGIATAGATTAPKNARWTKISAHLRARPNVGAHTIRTLSAGTRVLVLRSIRDSHRRGWYEVKAGGRTGWVAGWPTESEGSSLRVGIDRVTPSAHRRDRLHLEPHPA